MNEVYNHIVIRENAMEIKPLNLIIYLKMCVLRKLYVNSLLKVEFCENIYFDQSIKFLVNNSNSWQTRYCEETMLNICTSHIFMGNYLICVRWNKNAAENKKIVHKS